MIQGGHRIDGRGAVMPAVLSLSLFLLLAQDSSASSTSSRPRTVAAKSADGFMAPMRAKLDDSVVESPSAVRARMLLKAGARIHQQGNTAQAEKLFRQAIALDPANADAYFNLGALAEGKGDLVTALGQYRAGLALRQNDPELKEAVRSMEGKLRASVKETDEFRHPEPIFTVSDRYAPVLEQRVPEFPLLNAGEPDSPALDSTPLSQHNNTGGPFQLNANTSQLNVPLSLRQPDPLLVNQPVRPVQSVSQRSKTRGALNVLLTVGANAAMRGAGLHCPRCSLLRGFGGFGF